MTGNIKFIPPIKMVMTGGLFIIVLPTLFKNVMSLGYLPNSVGPFAKEMFSYLFGWVCARFFGIKWRPRAREPNEKKLLPLAELVSFQSFPGCFFHLCSPLFSPPNLPK